MKSDLIKVFTICAFAFFFVFYGCAEEEDPQKVGGQEEVAYSPEKDDAIQQYNLELERKKAANRFPCDTIAIAEYILQNYPVGTYLVTFDRTVVHNVPRAAILYHPKQKDYVFAVVVKSREGERVVEPKNLIGYDPSFVDFDSTKLGTPFFYLLLLQCVDGDIRFIWEAPIPRHGGFNNISLHTWSPKNIQFIRANYHYGSGVGHLNYNYFFINGLTEKPHLLMTYDGVNFRRTMANINNDEYPDYYEHVFYDLGTRIFSTDSVGFVWKDTVYVNTRNPRQTRPY